MKRTLVFGASLKPNRYSNLAINRLVRGGNDVLAFGLREGTVAGVKIDTELINYNNVDTVTLYMNPQRQAPFYDYLLSLSPNRIIFNPGSENREFYKILSQNGIEVLSACTLVMLATNQY